MPHAKSEAFKKYSEDERQRRLDEMGPRARKLITEGGKRKEYYAKVEEVQGVREELDAGLEILDDKLKRLAEAVTKRLPLLTVQRQLSIPVLPDEGGTGTSTRPQTGQILVAGANGKYTPQYAGTELHALSTKTVDYTATASDEILLVDASGGAVTITLPAAAGISGKLYRIKRINAGANAVTISAAENIDDDLTAVLTMKGVSLDIVSDGTQWRIF